MKIKFYAILLFIFWEASVYSQPNTLWRRMVHYLTPKKNVSLGNFSKTTAKTFQQKIQKGPLKQYVEFKRSFFSPNVSISISSKLASSKPEIMKELQETLKRMDLQQQRNFSTQPYSSSFFNFGKNKVIESKADDYFVNIKKGEIVPKTYIFSKIVTSKENLLNTLKLLIHNKNENILPNIVKYIHYQESTGKVFYDASVKGEPFINHFLSKLVTAAY